MGELRAHALGVKVVWSTVTTTLDALESAVRELLA